MIYGSKSTFAVELLELRIPPFSTVYCTFYHVCRNCWWNNCRSGCPVVFVSSKSTYAVMNALVPEFSDGA